MKEEVWISGIKEARNRLKGVINETHLQFSSTFSSWSGGEVFLKPENLQKTGSFKLRGAYNRLVQLSDREKEMGVVTASSGNHAQGVAYGAALLGIRAVIVMPEDAPRAKVDAVRGYGGEVVFYGYTSSERILRAKEISAEYGLTMIHSFDDPYVIQGQGTIGLEIVDELEDVDEILVPIGGGGLISGISMAVKMENRNVRIIGVEAEGAPTMTSSLKEGKRVKLSVVDTIADGIKTTQVGQLTYEIAKKYIDTTLLVSDEEIKDAIFYLLQRAKLLVEPAGAVTVAAILSGKADIKGKKAVAVLSGGNIDMSLLKKIIAR